MIELSISGKATGLVASSNINMFTLSGGSITELLANRLRVASEIFLPFEILDLFVQARPHDAAAKVTNKADGIRIRSHKELLRFKTGQLLKSYEVVLDNDNFYTLSKPEKHEALAAAFEKIAALVLKEFPDKSGSALAAEIQSAARDYLSGQLPGNEL